MNISEIKKLDKELKGFFCVGKVKHIGETKRIQGTSNGKDYDFKTTSLLVEDDSGSVYVQFSDANFGDVKGKTISCINCSINEYTSKDGVLKRNLRARDFSFDVIPTDTAHPELPPTRVLKDEEPEVRVEQAEKKEEKPQIYKLTPREIEEREYWTAKDAKKALFIARQHFSTDATKLVCKYYDGDLNTAVDTIIEITDRLVKNLYDKLA